MIDFQYHTMGHLYNDYPQLVITYCCLVKGNPGLIWLPVNKVYEYGAPFVQIMHINTNNT